eukprot:scaffold11873_cov297-Chaetoceros_neogracile.AAC.1
MLRYHPIMKRIKSLTPLTRIQSKRNANLKNATSGRRSMTTNNGSEYTKPKWKQNGTPEIIIGTAIISLISIDYYLQTQQDESRRDIMSTLQQTIRNDEQKEQKKDAEADSEAKVMESLFQCVVRKAPKFFDGSKSLMGIQIGDEVSVLKERVGPD